MVIHRNRCFTAYLHFLFLQLHIVLYLFILLILVYLWYGLRVLLILFEEDQTS